MTALPPTYREAQASLLANAAHPGRREDDATRQQGTRTAPASEYYSQAPRYSIDDSSSVSTRAQQDDSAPPDYAPADSWRRYGRYESEEQYLAALRKWAHAKQFYRPGELSNGIDNGLIGFYGQTTLEEYASRPGLQIRKRQKKPKDAQQADRQRRATVAVAAGAETDAPAQAPDTNDDALSRRATVDQIPIHANNDDDSSKPRRRGSSIFGGLLNRKTTR